MAWEYMAATENESPIFIDNVNADESGMMNSELYRA